MDDRRFRALTLALRGAYATLLDEADAAGVYAPAAGSTLRLTIARALGCSEAEGDAIVADLRAAGAIAADGPTLVLLVGTGAGARGGRPKALLMRVSRARVTGATGNAAGNPTGNAGGNEGSNVPVTAAGNGGTANEPQAPENKVEIADSAPVTDTGNSDAQGTVDAAPPSLPSVPPPSLPPHTPLSLTLSLSSPPTATKRARAVDGAPTAKRHDGPPPTDTIPLPGSTARRVFDAILADPRLGPTTLGPGEFSARIADPSAYPGVNVLAAVHEATEWLEKKPSRKVRDGRFFLRNWLKRAAADVADSMPVAALGGGAPGVVRPADWLPPPPPPEDPATRPSPLTPEQLRAVRPACFRNLDVKRGLDDQR